MPRTLRALGHIESASDLLADAISELKGNENKNAMRHASAAMQSIAKARGQLARAGRAALNKRTGKGLAETVKPILEKAEGVLEDAVEYETKRKAKLAERN